MHLPRLSNAELFALSLMAILLVTAALNFHLPRTYVMTRTASGWQPQQITIHKGDTVVFKTTAGEPFWPASNFHPTHTLYPEFDAKRPIPPDQTWSFTFERVGVWTMHDHLMANFTGTIIVTGGLGEAARECEKSASQYSSLSVACWENQIVDALRNGGMAKGFQEFDTLYKTVPSFQANCHDVSHILGSEAYKLFTADHAVVDTPETAYCGYGFYHGFIEAMLLTAGPGQYSDARAYCDALRAKDGDSVAGPCFHGIGHAVFDSLDSTLWGNASRMTKAGIALCNTALVKERDEDREQCANGVFNALGNALSAHDYGLSHETTNIIDLCRAQRESYKKDCMVQAGIGYIRFKQMNRSEALAFILSLEPDLAAPGINTYIDNEVLLNIKTFDPQAYHDTCASLPLSYQSECVRGVISALNNLGDPHQEYIPMFAFCATFNEKGLRSQCEIAAIQMTRALNTDNQSFKKACEALPDDEARANCGVQSPQSAVR